MQNLTAFNLRNIAFVLDNPGVAFKLNRTYKRFAYQGEFRYASSICGV